MANWAELKPIRMHRTIMTFVVIGLLSVLIFAPRYFFRSGINFSNQYQTDKPKVIAKSGLKIRSDGDINSEVLATVPYHAHINIIEKNGKQDNIKGQSGKWYKVQYQSVTGYAWSVYIDE